MLPPWLTIVPASLLPRLRGQQFLHHRLLFLQLVDGDVDLRAAEVIDLKALHDFQLVPVAVDGERADQARLDPIAAIGANTKAVPIAGMDRRGHEAHRVHVIVRGEKSDGMLCSDAELQVGDDSSGIWQLPENLTLGISLETALDLGDTVLDISVTPNRSDCLSMIGIAREVAAITGEKIKIPVGRIKKSIEEISSHTSVTIIDTDLCPRYTARLIKNVNVGSSPVWMKTRLESAGLRAINNVVDVTNFVMLEMGQPLHAFDFRYLEQGKIIVRKSRDDEEFTSLDGEPESFRQILY